MKNVYEVLRQKELELSRLEKEVEALRVAAPLLSEEKEALAEAPKPNLTATTVPQPVRIPPGGRCTSCALSGTRRRMGGCSEALAVSRLHSSLRRRGLPRPLAISPDKIIQ